MFDVDKKAHLLINLTVFFTNEGPSEEDFIRGHLGMSLCPKSLGNYSLFNLLEPTMTYPSLRWEHNKTLFNSTKPYSQSGILYINEDHLNNMGYVNTEIDLSQVLQQNSSVERFQEKPGPNQQIFFYLEFESINITSVKFNDSALIFEPTKYLGKTQVSKGYLNMVMPGMNFKDYFDKYTDKNFLDFQCYSVVEF
jgi:hypothetical protein